MLSIEVDVVVIFKFVCFKNSFCNYLILFVKSKKDINYIDMELILLQDTLKSMNKLSVKQTSKLNATSNQSKFDVCWSFLIFFFYILWLTIK